MCAGLKIVHLPAGSKLAETGPDVNGPFSAGPSNTADRRAEPGRVRSKIQQTEPGLKI